MAYKGWTATFTGYNAADNKANFSFTDGTNTYQASATPPNGVATLSDAIVWAKALTRNQIDRLVSSTTFQSAPSNTDVTPDPDPAPDSDQSLMTQWTTAVFNVRQSQKAVDLGLYDKTSVFWTTPFNTMMSIWSSATVTQKTKGLNYL